MDFKTVMMALLLLPVSISNGFGASVLDAYPFMYVTGKIEISDIERVKAILSRGQRIVRINSGGGSVAAAMSLGRLMRKNELMVTVESGARCASACIFILAGAVSRAVDGKVTVHRPYLKNFPADNFDYDSGFKKMEQDIRKYFKEMNIPSSLIDLMLSVPPERGYDLNPRQLRLFLLDGVDPAYEQKSAVLEAKNRGISLGEQRRRQSMQAGVCSWPYSGDHPDLFEAASHWMCKDAIMKGENPRKVKNAIYRLIRNQNSIRMLPEDIQMECIKIFIFDNSKNRCPVQ